MNPINPDFFATEPKPSDKTYTIDQIREMWPQAAGELRGFANALERGNSGLTAAQMRMAIQIADDAYKALFK